MKTEDVIKIVGNIIKKEISLKCQIFIHMKKRPLRNYYGQQQLYYCTIVTIVHLYAFSFHVDSNSMRQILLSFFKAEETEAWTDLDLLFMATKLVGNEEETST